MVRQQAQAEKLTLLVAKSKTGYYSVVLANPGQPNLPPAGKLDTSQWATSSRQV